jgi:hypothetical protein
VPDVGLVFTCEHNGCGRCETTPLGNVAIRKTGSIRVATRTKLPKGWSTVLEAGEVRLRCPDHANGAVRADG